MTPLPEIKTFWKNLKKELPARFFYESLTEFTERASPTEKQLKKKFLAFPSQTRQLIYSDLLRLAPNTYLCCLFLYFFADRPVIQEKILRAFLLRKRDCPNNLLLWRDYLSFYDKEFWQLSKSEKPLRNLAETYQVSAIRNLSAEILHFLVKSSAIYAKNKHLFVERLKNDAIVDLKLGYSCNDHCLHCVVDDFRDHFRAKQKDMDRTTEEYKKLLARYRMEGCKQVVFTGGEPSIRPDFVELLRFAWEIGFQISVQSNGRFFSRPALMKKLNFGKKDISFIIALHGPTAAIHDRITQKKGSQRETVAGIKNLRSAGYLVHGKMVLSKINYKYIKGNLQKFLTLGVNFGNIAFPHAQGAAWKNFDRVVPSYRTVAPYLKSAIAFQEKSRQPVFFDFETFPFCFLVDREEYCAELNYFFNKETILDAHGAKKADWQKIRPMIKAKFPQCKKCRYNDLCEGPWEEYSRKKGNQEFQPVAGSKWRLTDLQKAISRREEKSRKIISQHYLKHNAN